MDDIKEIRMEVAETYAHTCLPHPTNAKEDEIIEWSGCALQICHAIKNEYLLLFKDTDCGDDRNFGRIVLTPSQAETLAQCLLFMLDKDQRQEPQPIETSK